MRNEIYTYLKFDSSFRVFLSFVTLKLAHLYELLAEFYESLVWMYGEILEIIRYSWWDILRW